MLETPVSPDVRALCFPATSISAGPSESLIFSCSLLQGGGMGVPVPLGGGGGGRRAARVSQVERGCDFGGVAAFARPAQSSHVGSALVHVAVSLPSSLRGSMHHLGVVLRPSISKLNPSPHLKLRERPPCPDRCSGGARALHKVSLGGRFLCGVSADSRAFAVQKLPCV